MSHNPKTAAIGAAAYWTLGTIARRIAGGQRRPVATGDFVGSRAPQRFNASQQICASGGAFYANGYSEHYNQSTQSVTSVLTPVLKPEDQSNSKGVEQ